VEFAMLLAVCEGRHSRYEVCEHADGYLVQMRDLETGDLDEEFATLFRTMPVAFAYAEMSAAFDLCAAAELEGAVDDPILIDLEAREEKFSALSDRLGDAGLNGGSIKAWERAASGGTRRVYH
jgi:hypothetical protein